MSSPKSKSFNKEGKKRNRFSDAKPSRRRVTSKSKDGYEGEGKKRDRFSDAKPSRRRATSKSKDCLLYTSPSPRDGLLSRMPSSA